MMDIQPRLDGEGRIEKLFRGYDIWAEFWRIRSYAGVEDDGERGWEVECDFWTKGTVCGSHENIRK